MKEHDQPSPVTASILERVPGYLTVPEAATIMGVSERAVYGYIEAGKLPGARLGKSIVVLAESVHSYERKAPGRLRITTPRWHQAPIGNLLYLTTITARVRPGQGETLEMRLTEIRTASTHLFVGTSARYIARTRRDPDEVEIVLVWRSAVMPPDKEREAAIAALSADLTDVLDWETAVVTEKEVLMHA